MPELLGIAKLVLLENIYPRPTSPAIYVDQDILQMDLIARYATQTASLVQGPQHIACHAKRTSTFKPRPQLAGLAMLVTSKTVQTAQFAIQIARPVSALQIAAQLVLQDCTFTPAIIRVVNATTDTTSTKSTVPHAARTA